MNKHDPIVGRYVYFAIVERATSSLGVNSMWMCMGFFGAFFMLVCLYVGDFSWMIATALLGAYLAMTSLAEVVLIPYAPNGEEYRAFLTLTRDAVHRRDTEGIFQGLVADSPYLLGPLAAMAGLAFAGVLVQLFLFNKAAATKTRCGARCRHFRGSTVLRRATPWRSPSSSCVRVRVRRSRRRAPPRVRPTAQVSQQPARLRVLR